MKKFFLLSAIIMLAITVSFAINGVGVKAQNAQATTSTKIASSTDAKTSTSTGQNVTNSSTSTAPSAVSQKVIVPQTTTLDSCIKKYTEVLGVSSDEARTKCASVPQTSTTTVQVIEKSATCADLENRLAQLTGELQLAKTEQESTSTISEIAKLKDEISSSCVKAATTGVDACTEARKLISQYEEQLAEGATSTQAKKINSALKTQKARLEKCGAQQVTPAVKNPCDEVSSLKTAYEAMVTKEVQMEDMVQSGQLEQTALDDLHRQMEFLQKQIEQTQSACQQGNATIEEAPCSRLTKLELLYGQSQDSSVAKEIVALKERCLVQDISSGTAATNLVDVEEIYKTKIKAVVENTFGQDQVDSLKATEDEKNKLISDVLSKAEHLDATNVSIINKITVGDNKISLDGIEANPIPVEVMVNGKEINLSQTNGTVMINDAGSVAAGNVKIEYQDGKLVSSASGKEIIILPAEIKAKINAEPQSITLTDTATPKYEVTAQVKAKFLWFIPITTTRNFEVDAQTGQSTASSPWWSFLVRY